MIGGIKYHAISQVIEEWVVRYGYLENEADIARAMVLDEQGNIYVTGDSYGGPDTHLDFATVKYNSSGVMQWSARHNGSYDANDKPWTIDVDPAGNVFVAGQTGDEFEVSDMLTIKYDAYGNQCWFARYNGAGNDWDIANSIAVDQRGNAYVAGSSTGDGTESDFTIIKFSPDGIQEWVRCLNSPVNGSEHAYAITVDTEGCIYATGIASGHEELKYILTVKLSPSGEIIWVARYSQGWSTNVGKAIAVDSDGNVYVAGNSPGFNDYYDLVTIKYNPFGQELWVARYDGPISGIDQVEGLVLDGNGSVYVTGYENGDGSSKDYVTIKYDTDGCEEWVAVYNGPGNVQDIAYAITADDEGNVYVTGQSDPTGGGENFDYLTIMYNSEGEEQWVMRYDGPVHGNDHAKAIAVDQFGDVIVTGYSIGSGVGWSGNDFTTIKYSEPMMTDPEFASNTIPVCYKLYPAYPNPFNPSTTIAYFLPEAADVTLSVFDVHGRLVDVLVNGHRKSGRHDVTFDASGIPSGIYFYRLSIHDFESTDKMVLLK
jgi:uncharacterized delta-60 repeat protein